MPNPRLPGTSYISRLISKRFQVVDPKASGVIGGDVQPVYVVGEQGDATGLACRAFACVGSHILVAARYSYIGVESLTASLFELVVREITVQAQAATTDTFVYSVTSGSMGGGSSQQLAIAEGGRQALIPSTDALAQVNDTAGLPTQQLIDRFRVPTARGEETHTYPGGIICRPGQALMIINTTLNQAIDVVVRGTIRPLSG